MKIEKIVNAAICATKERRFVARNSKKPIIDNLDRDYYNILTKVSGTPAENPVQSIRNWYRAYQVNMQRENIIESLNKPFKTRGIIASIVDKIFK